MSRLRPLRFVIPGLLLVLVWFVWRNWQPRSRVHTNRSAELVEPKATGIEVREVRGDTPSFAGEFDTFTPDGDGGLRFEGIRELQLERAGRGPLLVNAGAGRREGRPGSEVWYFDQRVVFRDPEAQLELELPALVVDEVAGEARSEGDVLVRAGEVEGRGSALVWGLNGQPGRLENPVLRDRHGGRLTAQRARLLDGIRDVELEGDVELQRDGDRLEAARMHLLRDARDRLRRADASGGVSGRRKSEAGAEAVTVEASELATTWDEAGEVERLRLRGAAEIARAGEYVRAETLDVERVPDGWRVQATQAVNVVGGYAAETMRVGADRIDANLDDAMHLRSAEAVGSVQLQSATTSGDAARATFAQEPGRPARIELFGGGRRKARLGRNRTRVAADRIATDGRGETLHAEDRVEASLLQNDGGTVHFVSEMLDSTRGGARLVFRGAVRAWQGDGNLAAGEVTVLQRDRSLSAQGGVTTRIPRGSGGRSPIADDFLQIEAQTLEYDDVAGRAVYLGDARARFAEGWLDCERLEIRFDPDTGALAEITGTGSAIFELRSETDAGESFKGHADRLHYRAEDEALELFGDDSPAEARTADGTTTSGRVLRYRMDRGTVEVDSGERAPARIRATVPVP